MGNKHLMGDLVNLMGSKLKLNCFRLSLTLKKRMKIQTRASDPLKSEEETDPDEDDDYLDDLPEAKDLASKKPRASVSAEAFGAWNQRKKFEAKTYPKTKEQELAIREKLENAFMFKNLDASEKEIVIAAMEEKVTEPKEVVIKEGDEGDCLFVVSQGTLQC